MLFDLIVFYMCSPNGTDFDMFDDDEHVGGQDYDEDDPYDSAGEGGFLRNIQGGAEDELSDEQAEGELDEFDVEVDVDNNSGSFEEEEPNNDI